jgi:hypothetical protein
MFDDAGEHGDCSTIAERGGKSKTYQVQSARCQMRGTRSTRGVRQPYYNLVRFALDELEKEESPEKKAGKRKTALRNQGWGTCKKKSDPEFTGANAEGTENVREQMPKSDADERKTGSRVGDGTQDLAA